MKFIYLSLGFLFLGLGALGVILPVLPTTPFLLVSSYCFTRGSDKINNWFCSTKLYKNHLEEFLRSRSMGLKTKISILSFATTMLLIAFFSMDILPMRLTILFLIICKYYYFIFKIKTIRQ